MTGLVLTVAHRMLLRPIFIAFAAVVPALMPARLGAQDARMALCSARQDGVYYLAAEQIGRSLRNPELEVRAIETKGSLDNLKRMARGDCDAAIVQRDALMIQTMQDLSNCL